MSEALSDEGPQSQLSRYSLTELDFIQRVRALARDHSEDKSFILGIGDDAAITPQSADLETVITTDLLVEEIDFRRDTAPELLGHKALAVSLSDIAAMGATPRWALLSVGVPRKVWDSDFFSKFYKGYLALAGRYRVKLIGGDTSRTPGQIVIDSIVLGECERQKGVLRSGAKVGDQIFVTGSLGGSAAGLRLLENGGRLDANGVGHNEPPNDVELLLNRHLRPEPRVGWGIILGKEGLATAMIDISDGLSSDLNHLARESNVGALIESAQLPLDPSVTALAGRRALDPLMLALHGGEDFELLFTVAPEQVNKLPKLVDGISITHIGEVRPATEDVRIRERSHIWILEPGGWDHFRRGTQSAKTNQT